MEALLHHRAKKSQASTHSKTSLPSSQSFSSPFVSTTSSSSLSSSSSSSLATKGLQSLVNYNSGSLSSWKQQQSVVQPESHPIRLHKNHVPYHRRHATTTPQPSDLINFPLSCNFGTSKHNLLLNNKHVNTSNASHFNNNNATTNNNNLAYNTSNLHGNKSFFYQVPVFDSSPNSAAPSPLLASHGYVTSASANQNGGDPTMPTLSPQPSSKSGREAKTEGLKEDADFKNKHNPLANNVKSNHTTLPSKQHTSNNPVDNNTPSTTSPSLSTSLLFQHYSAHDFKTDPDLLLGNLEAPLKSELLSRIKNADIGRTWVDRRLRRKAHPHKPPTLRSLFEEEEEENKLPSFLVQSSL